MATLALERTLLDPAVVPPAARTWRVRCTNGMPRAGWLMFVLLHATWLRVTLERDT